MPKNGGVLVVPRSHGTRSGRSHRTRWSSVLHGGRQCCLKEPRSERKTTPARGSNTPDETFSAPARHGSGHHEIFIAHTHPKCPISDHFQRAGAIFLSHRHPTRPHGATQGRYFFHTGTPHDHTVLRRGDISFMHPPGAPPAWRTPEEPSAPRDAEPDHGAGRSRQGLASEKSHAIRLKEVSTTSENVAIPTI